jgi:hypothetical protein
MKTNYFICVAFLLLAQIGFAQENALTGVLLDNNNKAIKNHPVTIGKVSPITVKTDKYGIFTFKDANLQDTLYVGDKKGKNPIAIPVKGYSYITIQSQKGDFNTEYLSEPERQLLRSLQQMQRAADIRKRTYNSKNAEDIRLSGCNDIYCLLRTFAGINIDSNNEVQIMGANMSRYASTAALVVINGIPSGNLASVQLEDIETITVLKDASRYGLQGANGAIEIILKGFN